MDKSEGYVSSAYLQSAAHVLARVKERSYELMQIAPGCKVLDVGCGPGIDTLALARLVGDGGAVVGIDSDPAMVAEANRLATEAGVDAWTRHEIGNASALRCKAGSFEACRSERLFQHLANPSESLAEMARVTRSSGWVVAADTDWGSLSIGVKDADIERRVVRVVAEQLHRNGYGARQQ